MAETITVNQLEEVIKVTDNTEVISVNSGDVSFTLQETNEIINVSLVDNTTFLTIKDVSETIGVSIGEEVLNVSTVEEVLNFTFSEPTIIVNNTGGGVSELEMPYSTQIDFVNDNVIYKGWADPGSATSSAVWRIQKITFIGADDDVVITWADGDGLFDNIWDNHLSLTYT